MLAISENAAEAIKGIVANPEIPDGSGVRIAASESQNTPSAQPLELMIVTGPAEQDAVVEENGAQVFLDPQAAELLDDKRLEARVEGEQVGFTIEEQGASAA